LFFVNSLDILLLFNFCIVPDDCFGDKTDAIEKQKIKVIADQ